VTTTYAILGIPRPAFDEIRERLIDRQPSEVAREYRRLLRDDGELLVLGVIAFKPVDAVGGVYPRDSWQTPGPGPMDSLEGASANGNWTATGRVAGFCRLVDGGLWIEVEVTEPHQRAGRYRGKVLGPGSIDATCDISGIVGLTHGVVNGMPLPLDNPECGP
jgi:hypothetical protein